jgi:DNA modification methylase
MSAEVIHGDCLEVMPSLAAQAFDAVICDPPYGLGFMGKHWDHGVPGVDFWIEAKRVAKPGSYLLAFGGTRTFHRLTVAIEDAGWEIRDCLSWLYGSGFPKSLNVGQALIVDASNRCEPRRINRDGWGTALKPAWEPIIMARNPFKGTVAANVQEHGTGAINIDACRIGTDERTYKGMSVEGSGVGVMRDDNWKPRDISVTVSGRWPANVVIDEMAADALDEQSGTLTTNAGTARSNHKAGIFGIETMEGRTLSLGESGGASRFFYTAKASRSERDYGLEGSPLKDGGIKNDSGRGYSERDPYATIKVRNNHPTVKPVELMRWLCRLVTPPQGRILDPFTGSGTTGVAATLEGFSFVGIEREEEYAAIARKRITETPPSLFGEVA